jgi:hypothetical protein
MADAMQTPVDHVGETGIHIAGYGGLAWTGNLLIILPPAVPLPPGHSTTGQCFFFFSYGRPPRAII